MAEGMPAGIIGGGDRWVKSAPLPARGPTPARSGAGSTSHRLRRRDQRDRGLQDHRPEGRSPRHLQPPAPCLRQALDIPSSGRPERSARSGCCASFPRPSRPRREGRSVRAVQWIEVPGTTGPLLSSSDRSVEMLDDPEPPPAAAGCTWCDGERFRVAAWELGVAIDRSDAVPGVRAGRTAFAPFRHEKFTKTLEERHYKVAFLAFSLERRKPWSSPAGFGVWCDISTGEEANGRIGPLPGLLPVPTPQKPNHPRNSRADSGALGTRGEFRQSTGVSTDGGPRQTEDRELGTEDIDQGKQVAARAVRALRLPSPRSGGRAWSFGDPVRSSGIGEQRPSTGSHPRMSPATLWQRVEPVVKDAVTKVGSPTPNWPGSR